MTRNRISIIIAAAVVVIGGVIGIWYLFAGDDAELTVGDPFAGLGGGEAVLDSDLPTTGIQQQAGEQLAPRLIRITEGPVARGVAAFGIQVPVVEQETATTSTSTVRTVPDVEVRFIDRASGNIYAYVAKERTLTRISNRTVPGIQEASWVADGSRAYVRFISSTAGGERVDTFMLPANGEGGFLLEQGTNQALVAGTSTLMTLFGGTTGSVATIANIDGSNSRTLFSSLLSSIMIRPSSGPLYVATKPSALLDGYAFQVSRTNGAFSRILGPFRGLSILPSPNGSRVVFSYVESGTPRLRVFDAAARTSTALPVATLAEKCVWTANGAAVYCGVPTSIQGMQPDMWYQGATAFTDRIWRIDMVERVATLIVDPNEIGGITVDAVALSLDPSEDFLIFMDKASGALYAYDL